MPGTYTLNTLTASNARQKLVIYQLFVRYFGNTNTTNRVYGSIEENGCGKFNDITETALLELKKLGINTIWSTGVIEHATMTDYTAAGIAPDYPVVVKGRAGSPYAIKDYYDVAPDLAENVAERMAEFEALIERSKKSGFKVLIDFVPNHVARTYKSDRKPAHLEDLGENENPLYSFSVNNDFYYIPDQQFVAPKEYVPAGGKLGNHRPYREYPAKATGNDVFVANPGINDWFETIKLNYGVDIEHGKTEHFVPHPALWKKLLDILLFWAGKGVDGFRCDMVEMVPVAFWNWVITAVKKKYPELIFIGEAYNTSLYAKYVFNGNFDYLYDKVGLYECLRRLIANDRGANTTAILQCIQATQDIDQHMLHFLENHDEQRIASKEFAGNPWFAVPGMIVSATVSKGPIMIYNGQEVGEKAVGSQGFSGDDGRSSIFDYTGMPEHQRWLNGKAYDGGGLAGDQKKLREFYAKVLSLANTHPVVSTGKFLEVPMTKVAQGKNSLIFSYLRYIENKYILVVVNFDRTMAKFELALPNLINEKAEEADTFLFTDLLSGIEFESVNARELIMELPATSGVVLELVGRE